MLLRNDDVTWDLHNCHIGREWTSTSAVDCPNYWIHTHTGKRFSYTHTQPDQICIEDIAHALARICRYAGHIKVHYSVADHCCNLVEYCDSLTIGRVANPHWLLGVLLHDAAEAYLSDIPAPAKNLLQDFKRLEKKIYGHIASRFGAPDGPEFQRELDFIDKNIVRDEALALFDATPDWVDQFEKLDIPIEVSPTAKFAEERYLDTYYDIIDRIQAKHEAVYE